jgi:hypothetical protein
MSDVAGAAAPAAAPVPNGAPRNNSGQFSPKAGATGVAPQAGAQASDGAPPSGPQTPEEWAGYEGEVDVYGEKVNVKVGSKAEALRAHQELLAYRKRVRDIAAAEKRYADMDRADPEQLLRERGVDVNELARRRVLEAAKLVDMTEEQRENHTLKQRLAAYEQQQQQAEQERQQAEQQQALQQRRQVAVAGLEKGLELSGLPKTHHTMALLAEIQQECTAQRLPPLPPDLLAAEANKRYNERGVEPLKKLTGTSLLSRLGPDVVRAVLMAERERRGLAAGQPRQAPAQAFERELPQADGDKVYGEAEAEAKLRALRNRR